MYVTSLLEIKRTDNICSWSKVKRVISNCLYEALSSRSLQQIMKSDSPVPDIIFYSLIEN